MSAVVVRKPHQLPAAEARRRIGLVEKKLGEFGIRLVWTGDRATIQAPGVSGDATLGADFVEISLKLGLVARLAGVDAARLERAIARRLEQALAPEPPAELSD